MEIKQTKGLSRNTIDLRTPIAKNSCACSAQ